MATRALVSLALTLVPFAGIAFLWFMGVVRAHLGKLEDQFFSSVMFGSGLLFLAMVFAAAAMAGGIVASYAIAADQLIDNRRGGLWASRDVYDHECLCHPHGGRVYDFVGHHLGSNAGGAAPVCVFHLCPGAAAAGDDQFLAVDDFYFPAWVFVISVYILRVSVRGKSAEAEGFIGSGDATGDASGDAK